MVGVQAERVDSTVQKIVAIKIIKNKFIFIWKLKKFYYLCINKTKQKQLKISQKFPTMKKAIIMMIVVFALVVWPFSGVWQLLSGIIGGGVRESFIYPIYGGIILLSGIIVVCTELILEEIKSLKDDIKDKQEGC